MKHPLPELDALLPASTEVPGLPDLDDAVQELFDPRDFARRSVARRLGEEGAWVLAGWMEPRRLLPGEALYTYGQPASTAYLFCSGSLEAVLPLSEQSLVLGEVPLGSWLGEVQLIDQGPASATVRAVAPSLVLGLSHEVFERIRADDPAVATDILRGMLADLAERIRRCSAGVVARGSDGQWVVLGPEHTASNLLAELVRAAS